MVIRFRFSIKIILLLLKMPSIVVKCSNSLKKLEKSVELYKKLFVKFVYFLVEFILLKIVNLECLFQIVKFGF